MRETVFILYSFIITSLCACSFIYSKDYTSKDLLGAWLSKNRSESFALSIYTEKYALVIISESGRQKSLYKCEYSVEQNGAFLVKSYTTSMMMKDSHGLYLDSTPYWMGIPMDNKSIARKISNDEAVKILTQLGVTKKQVEELPIEYSHGKTLIEDSSAPDIIPN